MIQLPALERWVLCVTLMMLAKLLAAAASPQDSLLEALRLSSPNSLERAKVLYALSQAYREAAPDEAIQYGSDLIELSKNIGSDEYLYWGHMANGVGHAIKGEDYDQALSHFIQALEIATQSNSTDWKLKQIKARINITGVYWRQQEIPLALPYLYSNILELKELGEELTLADCYQSMALMQQSLQQFDSSFFYIQNAIDIYETLGETQKRNNALLTSGNIHRDAGNFRKSLATLQRALRFASIDRDTALIIEIYPSISHTYRKLSQIEQAKFFAREGMELARQKGQLPDQLKANEALYEIFEATGQFDSALFYFKAYSGLKERVLNQEKINKIQELTISYQARQKVRENELLRRQYAAIHLQNTALIASSILLLGLIALATFLNRRLRRQKEELEAFNQEFVSINTRLIALMNEKKHMVSLIAHDIRNPLSLIQLNTHALAQNAALSEEERRQILSEIENATNNIDSASLKIIEIENESIEKGHIQIEPLNLNQSLKESIREFQTYARSKSIELRANLPETNLFTLGDPFLVRHIIDNLLSNAIKYSPPGQPVEVALENEAGKLSIHVKDGGPGLSPEDMERVFQKGLSLSAKPTSGESSRGEGLYLARRFARAMGGQISVKSKPGQGAVFSAQFPKAN